MALYLGSNKIASNGGSSGEGGSSYELPIASADTLGGIKVGENLSIDENGVLSATAGSGEAENEVYSTSEVKTNKVWIDGKPIYRKVINFGNLPNAAIGYVQTGFAQGEIFVTRASGVTTNGTTQYFLPYVHPTTLGKCVSLYAETTSGNIVVTIRTGEDRSAHTAYVILEYTKTTD